MKVVTDSRHYDEIAKQIKEYGKVGDDVTFTPEEMHGQMGVEYVYNTGVYDGTEKGIQEGYASGFSQGEEQGRQAQYDELWDDIQSNGAVKSYMRYFQGAGWSDKTFNPKHNIVTTNLQATFYGNNRITRIPVLVDMSRITNSVYTGQSFYGCSSLQTLSLKVAETTPWSTNTFQNCSSLSSLTIDGTIGMDGFDVHWSVRLLKHSLLSILNACNGTTHTTTITVTLPPRCIDNDTSTETYIANDTELSTALANARNKNYSIVYG